MFKIKLASILVVFLTLTGCASTERTITTAPETPAGTSESAVASTTNVSEQWHHLDTETGPFPGTATEKAYSSLLNGKKPKKKVIVAVIDSGVDIEHEDLDDVIWVNTDEIPDNGKDDDNNGYVDDVHGWNFIGGPDGRHVGFDTYEVTRELARLSPRFEEADPANLSEDEQEEYAYYQKVKAAYDERFQRNQQNYLNTRFAYSALAKADSILTAHFGTDEYTSEQLEKLNSSDEQVQNATNIAMYFKQFDIDLDDLRRQSENLEGSIRYGLNPTYDPRDIVGDDYDDPSDRYYGNNNVKGPEPFHGTHVAGIIAAERDNDLGVKGIANSVEIMVIRAVPNGDERDKDVANAIRYAVENGADIINMSFGKDFSPQKELVDEAVRFADENNVLLVHAAGNDAENLDSTASFPTRTYLDGSGQAELWLDVGASSLSVDEQLAASFSNYGLRSVDLFAPGVNMYSTVPGNGYDHADGTSAAAPVVSGVAALIMSYYPELTARQVRDILVESVVTYPGTKVVAPGSGGSKVVFSSLSMSGGIVNSYEALKKAGELVQ